MNDVNGFDLAVGSAVALIVLYILIRIEMWYRKTKVRNRKGDGTD